MTMLTTTIHLAKPAFELGIVNPVVCMIKGVTITENSTELDEPVTALMEQVQIVKDQWLATKETQGFKDLFTKMGYPKQIPAGERLLESFAAKGFRRFGNIVDAYNMVSMESVSGIGMHDADTFEGHDITIRRAKKGEQIIPQFKTKAEKIIENDLVYGTENSIAAWLGKRDYDSSAHCVTAKTTNLLLVVLGNANTDEEFNRSICERTFNYIKLTCPEATLEYLNIKKE